MAHVSESKKKTVSEFVHLLDTYPVIGTVNMSNLPVRQLQKMRSKLREKNTVLLMTKKRLMKIAFTKSKKKNIIELTKHLKGLPALVFTNENPFKLSAELQKTKSKAPAKAGQVAPKDITINAGPTSFSPGPLIGQLGKYGIKTGIEGGKIVIKEDAVVVKEGEIISAELAGILSRLEIEPMEIGLNLTSVYEEGQIYTSDVLYVDESEYKNKIVTSYQESLNLAIYIGYTNKDTINILLQKAYNEAKSLALTQAILTDETVVDLVKNAYANALSLSNKIPAADKQEQG